MTSINYAWLTFSQTTRLDRNAVRLPRNNNYLTFLLPQFRISQAAYTATQLKKFFTVSIVFGIL